MTKIKFCGLSRIQDIEAANELKPEYIGFVFAEKSKRRVLPEQAEKLKKLLLPDIKAVGVFVNESPEMISHIVKSGIIDIVQLHGAKDEAYIEELRKLIKCPIIKAFTVKTEKDVEEAEKSRADYILLDSGAGTGNTFDWSLLKSIKRPYFLAGGLSPENVGFAAEELFPYAVDVSSGIETDGIKDKIKMAAFIRAVRKEDKR